MKATKRDLIGRKIVNVEWRKFARYPDNSPDKSTTTDPILILDNGRRVWFMTAETEVGEYGTDICISDRKS